MSSIFSMDLTEAVVQLNEASHRVAPGERILHTQFYQAGPDAFGTSKNETFGRACSAGFVRANCYVTKTSRDGDAGFREWASDVPSDGRAIVRFGVPAGQFWQGWVTITEKSS
jgi:hypothetical protein